MDMFGRKDRIECLGELCIVVTDQEVKPRRAFFQIPHNLACLLVHPGSIWMLGTASEVNTTAAQLDKEEHVERLQSESFYREKVACQDLVAVMGHELSPAWRTTPVGGR